MIVLASQSTARRAMLTAAGVVHDALPAHIDEDGVTSGLQAEGASPERIADALAEGGVCLEVSTAGLRKAARELYPSRALLERCNQRGVPIVLSSDAHAPADIARDFELAVEAAVAAGYSEVQQLKGRDRRAVPIG